jgi:hypothetical protein
LFGQSATAGAQAQIPKSKNVNNVEGERQAAAPLYVSAMCGPGAGSGKIELIDKNGSK